MKKSWYEYSQNFFKTAELSTLVGRTVKYAEDKKHYLVQNVKDRQNADMGPQLTLKGIGGTWGNNYELLPETKEEFVSYIEHLKETIEDFKLRIQCLEETKTDRVDPEGFEIWKLVKAIRNETDEDQLTRMISAAIKKR